MRLTREAILGVEDLKTELVEIPEWGGSVYVRCMTGVERDAWELEVYKTKGKNMEINRENFRARLLVRTVVDEKGKRLFQNEDMAVLGEKSAKCLDRLLSVANRLNGLSREDVDDLTKNSQSGRKENSTSSSPGNLE